MSLDPDDRHLFGHPTSGTIGLCTTGLRAPAVGVVVPDPVPGPPIGPGPGVFDVAQVEAMRRRCASVDSFGRTFKGAICPVHGGSRCTVEIEVREPARLHPADLEAIARRVAELLRGRP